MPVPLPPSASNPPGRVWVYDDDEETVLGMVDLSCAEIVFRCDVAENPRRPYWWTIYRAGDKFFWLREDWGMFGRQWTASKIELIGPAEVARVLVERGDGVPTHLMGMLNLVDYSGDRSKSPNPTAQERKRAALAAFLADETMTIEQAAEKAGVSARTLYRCEEFRQAGERTGRLHPTPRKKDRSAIPDGFRTSGRGLEAFARTNDVDR